MDTIQERAERIAHKATYGNTPHVLSDETRKILAPLIGLIAAELQAVRDAEREWCALEAETMAREAALLRNETDENCYLRVAAAIREEQ